MPQARLLAFACLTAVIAILPASLRAQSAPPVAAAVRRDADRDRSRERDHRSASTANGTPSRKLQPGDVRDRGARRDLVAQLPSHGTRRRTSRRRSHSAARSPGQVTFSRGHVHLRLRPAQRLHARLVHGRLRTAASALRLPPPPEHDPASASSGPATTSACGTRTASTSNGRTIPAGTYTVDIYDYSSIHNFELEARGLGAARPRFEWHRARASGRPRSRPGEGEYECDPHDHFMYGRVPGRPPDGPPPPPSTASTASASAPTPTAAAPVLLLPHPPPVRDADRHRPVPVKYTIDVKHPDAARQSPQVAPGTYTIQVDDQAAEAQLPPTRPGRRPRDVCRRNGHRELDGHPLRRAPTPTCATRTATG